MTILFSIFLVSVLSIPQMVLAFGLGDTTLFELYVGSIVGFAPFTIVIGVLLAMFMKRRYLERHPGGRYFLQQFFIVIGVVVGVPLIFFGFSSLTSFLFQ